MVFKKNEKAILRRTKKSMCSQKVVDRKMTEEWMDGVEEGNRPVSNCEWS